MVRQTELTAQLCSIMRDVRNVRGNTQKKIEKLRQLLSGLLSELTYFEEVFICLFLLFNSSFKLLGLNQLVSIVSGQFLKTARIWAVILNSVSLSLFQPIRSPLAPNVLITGIVPSESSIFKSALHPLRLTFRAANGGNCKIIFKKGDDIRQDQLVAIKHSLSLTRVCACDDITEVIWICGSCRLFKWYHSWIDCLNWKILICT